MGICLVFSGQGAQIKGMGLEFYEKYESIRKIYDQFPEIRDISFSGEEINRTDNAQPCLYLFNYAVSTLLEKKAPYSVGMSLGEYNAMNYAGAFDFETGMKLVKKRGELMQKYLQSDSSMFAVVDKENRLEEFVKNLKGIEISNYNSHKQKIIGGKKVDLEVAVKELKENGFSCIPLPVSGAFHTSLLNGASEEFGEFLKDFTFGELQSKVVFNLSGDESFTTLKENMIKQINHPVKFTQSIEYLASKGINDFVEISTKSICKSLISNINPNANITTITNVEELMNYNG